MKVQSCKRDLCSRRHLVHVVATPKGSRDIYRGWGLHLYMKSAIGREGGNNILTRIPFHNWFGQFFKRESS